MAKTCCVCSKPPETGKGVKASGRFYCCYACVKHSKTGKPKKKKNVCEFC
ncbi:hypothetical protein HYS54_00480 [Candidatus Micrarchaeota archaeon]|nr:hypothetical protein [Candidatus Micrarchaeota archaeon]